MQVAPRCANVTSLTISRHQTEPLGMQHTVAEAEEELSQALEGLTVTPYVERLVHF